MDRKKIEIVIVMANQGIGGAQRVSIALAEQFVKKGHQAFLMVLSDTSDKKYEIPSGIPVLYPYRDRDSKRAGIKDIRNSIRQVNPDVILVMGVPMSLYMVPALMGTRTRMVISERNDPSHFAGKVHTKILSRFLMRFADGYVFQTKDAQRYYPDSIQRKSVVIPNPLMGSDKIPLPYSGVRRKEIVTAGRLNPQKNQKLLINAFSKVVERHPDYSLIIYGEGPIRIELEESIRGLDLQGKVLLPGAIENVLEKMNESSMFVMSSDFEGMPNALMEAMALGLPCISTDCPCGGPRELIDGGNNGILVPTNDEESLADSMLHLIDNKDAAREIGNNASKIRTRLSMDEVFDTWMDFLGKM